MKKDTVKSFNDKIQSKPPKKNYPTKKIVNNHIDEIRSIDMMDMSDYKVLNNKWFRYIIVKIHNFSRYTWFIPLKI